MVKRAMTIAMKESKKEEKKNGRPPMYTDDLARDICGQIASNNLGLEALCDINPHWPAAGTIFRWLHEQPGFSEQYTEAKKRQIDVFMNDINNLTNESHYYIDADGNKRIDASILRTKVDARKWMACKLVPKVYGDRQQVDTTIVVRHEDALKELE
jgi:hypothetical protein